VSGIIEGAKEIVNGIIKGYQKRDIVKLVRTIEEISPIISLAALVLGKNAKDVGKQTGLSLGNGTNEIYQLLPDEVKVFWEAERWLHHGALGDLLKRCGEKKLDLFLIGLGEGLMESDAKDRAEWYSKEYYVALKKLEKMP